MKYVTLSALLLVSALFIGCARAPLNQDVSQSLQDNKIAVVYAQWGKRIEYEELVYKVFWAETRTKSVSFDGLWDIDTELSKYLASKFGELGLNTVSIYDVVSQENVLKLHEALATTGFEEVLLLDDSLCTKLLEGGVEYLITIGSPYIRGYSQIGVKGGSAMTWMYVHDLRAKEQKYFNTPSIGGNFEVKESIREIENDNLAELKSAMKNWIDVSVTIFISKQLGLSG